MIKALFLILLTAISFVSCTSTKKETALPTFTVTIDDQFLVEKNQYCVDDQFNFHIQSDIPIQGVFALLTPYNTDTKIFVGQQVDDTPFSFGHTVIVDRTNGQNLYYESQQVNNYLSAQSDAGKTSFSVKAKSIVSRSYSTTTKLYCYCFCDLDNNKYISENELTSLVINLNPANKFGSTKIHVSTTGYKIRDYSIIGKDYVVYRLSSYQHYLMFKELSNAYLSNYDMIFDSEKHFDSNTSYYIVLAPETTHKTLSQPYTYSNSDCLIFDLLEADTTEAAPYIPARNYMVKKSSDDLTICINIDGKIIFPEVIYY